MRVMKVETPVLEDGRLPVRYSVDGRGFSPPVRWRDAPKDAQELVLMMETVNASGEVEFVHWIAWGLDPKRESLDEGLMSKPDPDEPAELKQGTADSGKTGYEAPVGTLNRPQRLRLRALALDSRLDLSAGTDALREAVRGRVLDEGKRRFEYVRSS